jgi:hypothetical protein
MFIFIDVRAGGLVSAIVKLTGPRALPIRHPQGSVGAPDADVGAAEGVCAQACEVAAMAVRGLVRGVPHALVRSAVSGERS